MSQDVSYSRVKSGELTSLYSLIHYFRYYKARRQVKVVESDHNPIYLLIDLPWDTKIIKPRLEVFNLRNSECQANFLENTNSCDILTSCLINKDIRVGGKLWLKNMKFLIHANFKKIRLNGKSRVDETIQSLFEKQSQMQKDTPEFLAAESGIAEAIWEKNRAIVIEQISGMSNESNNFSRINMWKIRQKICPKHEVTPPVAKIDEKGNLISNKDGLMSLYVNTYKHRLRHRDMESGFSYLRDLKDFLFEERLQLSKLRKTPWWTEHDLLKVQKSLKLNKSADPSGFINELFRPGVAGRDVVKSLLLISNKSKEESDIPDFVKLSNITSIYKLRGSKSDLNSDRGVFSVSAVRSVIDKLVYHDIYDTVDTNMSDSNVGGRRGRNIRDNLFIIHGVINYALKEKIDIDVNLYDIEKCFDSMWWQETMNDMWDVGVQDDKFALMAKMNQECAIAVKTPVGITERFSLKEIEMQGTVMGPLKASVQVDTLGRDCYARSEGLFVYKKCVYIPISI